MGKNKTVNYIEESVETPKSVIDTLSSIRVVGKSKLQLLQLSNPYTEKNSLYGIFYLPYKNYKKELETK